MSRLICRELVDSIKEENLLLTATQGMERIVNMWQTSWHLVDGKCTLAAVCTQLGESGMEGVDNTRILISILCYSLGKTYTSLRRLRDAQTAYWKALNSADAVLEQAITLGELAEVMIAANEVCCPLSPQAALVAACSLS
jgi:hypothetical protein